MVPCLQITQKPYQVNKEGNFLANVGTSAYLGDPKKRNSPKSIGITNESDGKFLVWLPGLKGHLKVQFEIIYEKYPQSRFKKMYGQLLFLLDLWK